MERLSAEHSSASEKVRVGFFVALSVLLLVLGCKGESSDPPGSVLVGDAASFGRVLASCSQLDQTPAGRWCQTMGESLQPCQHFLSRCDAGQDCTVASALECADHRALEGFGLSSDEPWMYRFVSEVGWGVEVRGHEPVSDAAAGVSIELINPEKARWARWLPGRGQPGRALLSQRDALVHLRIRPAGGLGISSSIGEQSLADRLFSLKSELFTAAVLDGNIELTVYLPDGRQLIPPAALALDFKFEQPATLAMEGFIEDLRARYPLSRTDFEVDGYSGACLANLRVMPDLAPCYVATDRALIIGWNPESIRLALSPTVDGESQEGNRLQVFLDRFSEADRLLAVAHGRKDGAVLDYPWAALRITGSRSEEVVRFDVELESGDGS